MRGLDLKNYKISLRNRYKELRRGLGEEKKKQMDAAIFAKVTRLQVYQNAETVLVYVSTPIEVDTHALIRHALAQGKRVAVPYCIPGTVQMEFYYISSMDELASGTFGVLEPNPETSRKAIRTERALCIMPGLAYDKSGYRLGYGKGYYDRFLSRFQGIKVGICYSACIRGTLPHGRYDVPADLLVSEKYVSRIAKTRPRFRPEGC